MDKHLKEKLLVKDKWLRGFFMLFFIVVYYLVSWLILLISLFQFVVDLLLGQPNNRLLEFTTHLNIYLLQTANFMAFNSEIKPFPFTHWPDEKNEK